MYHHVQDQPMKKMVLTKDTRFFKQAIQGKTLKYLTEVLMHLHSMGVQDLQENLPVCTSTTGLVLRVSFLPRVEVYLLINRWNNYLSLIHYHNRFQ